MSKTLNSELLPVKKLQKTEYLEGSSTSIRKYLLVEIKLLLFMNK